MRTRGNYVRICVEVDLHKQLLYKYKLGDRFGSLGMRDSIQYAFTVCVMVTAKIHVQH
ncbi:hypothetical protein LINPERPRIM_LOCUS31720 [Linum perenne]